MFTDLEKADSVGSGLFELRDDSRAGPTGAQATGPRAVCRRCRELWQNIKAADVAAATATG